MRIVIEMDPDAGSKFLAYLSSVRTRAANELVAAQREVDIARMTDIVNALGRISAGLTLAMDEEAEHNVAFREAKKRELRAMRERGDV